MLPNGLANYGSIKLFSDINYKKKEVTSPTLKKTLKDVDDTGSVE